MATAVAPDKISRNHALLVARAQRDIHEASENLTAIADELGLIVALVEGHPTDESDDAAQEAFWQPFYDEADAELAEAVTA